MTPSVGHQRQVYEQLQGHTQPRADEEKAADGGRKGVAPVLSQGGEVAAAESGHGGTHDSLVRILRAVKSLQSTARERERERERAAYTGRIPSRE